MHGIVALFPAPFRGPPILGMVTAAGDGRLGLWDCPFGHSRICPTGRSGESAFAWAGCVVEYGARPDFPFRSLLCAFSADSVTREPTEGSGPVPPTPSMLFVLPPTISFSGVFPLKTKNLTTVREFR